ncbi:hypothetical protein FG93_01944 [Bosea sp. LC85]|uniref:hypothetical protein n=1 Tax=Bosea sp. LC85 TaxID=1502851 RepID=UPI0004E4425F|nr:hypothetical protein [Bosea sp. LC85]KFC73200.1 hypothetical protein FG93_01944 [Bosea sp. LC85]
MFDPAAAISDLDQELGESGQSVTLSRPAGGPADLVCQAFVRGYKPEQLVGAITQQDSLVILSPTALAAVAWPVPEGGDRVKVGAVWKRVQAAGPIYMAGVLVRVELQVLGS